MKPNVQFLRTSTPICALSWLIVRGSTFVVWLFNAEGPSLSPVNDRWLVVMCAFLCAVLGPSVLATSVLLRHWALSCCRGVVGVLCLSWCSSATGRMSVSGIVTLDGLLER